jgi:hypothetical protein
MAVFQKYNLLERSIPKAAAYIKAFCRICIQETGILRTRTSLNHCHIKMLMS